MKTKTYNEVMKKRMLILLVCCSMMMGCSAVRSLTTGSGNQQKAEQKVETAKKAIQDTKDKLEDKATAFVWGAKYANNKETNRTPAVEISSRFIDLAQLTIGNPSVKDASSIKEIADSLLQQYRADIDEAKIKAALSKQEVEAAKTDLQLAKKQIADGEVKLKAFEGTIVALQTSQDKKETDLEVKVQKYQEVADKNAILADKWNEENGFWASLNPFTDLWKFVKKLFTLGLVGGALFLVFKVAEIFFPELNILGAVFGGMGKLVAKFVPKATQAMGVVGKGVYTALGHSVKAIDATLDKLKNHPIEDDVLANFPDDKVFNKLEVKKLLETLSGNIETMLKGELSAATTEETRGIIIATKAATGISDAKLPGA